MQKKVGVELQDWEETRVKQDGAEKGHPAPAEGSVLKDNGASSTGTVLARWQPLEAQDVRKPCRNELSGCWESR